METAARRRQAVLAFDRDGLAGLAESDGATGGAIEGRMAQLWLDFMRGGDAAAGFDDRARVVFSDAQKDKCAELVIEMTALRALGALAAERLDEATELARRASRMGRTEALPEEEFLANVVLARVRRHGGEPHLAGRILGALAPRAPASWRGWIALELVLAVGAEDGAAALPQLFADPADGARGQEPSLTGAGPAARSLRDLFRSAHAGQRAGFASAGHALAAALAGCEPLAAEGRRVVQLLDPDLPVDAVLGAWCLGETDALPLGLHGISPRGESEAAGDNVIAHVVAHPGATGRRVLTLGLPLGSRGEPLIPLAPEGQGAQGRTLGAIAALALAGPAGLERDVFWKRVYGFAYAPSVHRSVLNVLVHRVRKRLDGKAELERDDDHLALVLSKPLAVPDPRCTESTMGRVLRVLARKGVGKTEELADALQVTARTVQNALQQLLADGACQMERQGREILYRVDDTTFTEPTGWAPAAPGRRP